MKHGVGKEGIERDMLSLFRRDEHVGDRDEYLVVLRTHRILELQTSGAFLELNFFVVG